jgi:hypothetical protein
MTWTTLWRGLWPLPWTLLGLLLGAWAWTLGAQPRRRAGALEFVGGRVGRWASRSPFAALTLGHVILAVSAAEADRLGPHERYHVRQYEAWGPFFVPAYLLAGAWAWLQGGCAHADNAFERHAVPA